MLYDLVEMVNCVYCIFVADCRRCIISPTLNLVSRNKVDWLKVGGLFLYLPTYWYHMGFGICRAVSVAWDRTCK